MIPCRCCKSTDLQPLLDLGHLPIIHRLLKSPDDDCKLYPLKLFLCDACGLVQVLDPIDPEELYRDFNFNFSSWKPEPQYEDEVDTIMDLSNPKAVLEIGANDGRFLVSLRERGVETGVGIEPNRVSGALCAERGFTVYPDMLTTDLTRQIVKTHGIFDVFVARQVVEHLVDLENFLNCAQIALSPEGMLFISVPDVEALLASGDLSMFWEEHVNYFTEPVMLGLLNSYGFEPVSVKKYNFSGGCLSVLARRGGMPQPRTKPEKIIALAKHWPERSKEFGTRLELAIEKIREKGYDVVMYGAGVRACPWSNLLDFKRLVDAALDDRRERQGLFLPLSRLPIVAPESVAKGDKPLLCLLAVNNESEEKVKARFSAIAERPVTYATLCAPKDIWADLALIERLGEP